MSADQHQMCTFALEGVLLWSVFNGMGKHMADLTTEELIISFKTIPAAYVTVSALNVLKLFWTMLEYSCSLPLIVIFLH